MSLRKAHAAPQRRRSRSSLVLLSGLLVLGGCAAEPGVDEVGRHEGAAIASKTSCWRAEIGTGLRMSDDESRPVTLPFPFAFYGRTYTNAYVNSNGNITFNRLNSAYAQPTVPRGDLVLIAPFFGDLNPGADGLGNVSDVFVATHGTTPNRTFVVTWQAVPEYLEPHPNTFQVLLHESGRVTVSYKDLLGNGFNGTTAMSAGIASGAGPYTRLATGTGLPNLAHRTFRFDPAPAGGYQLSEGCEAPPANKAPRADAGPDAVAECTGAGAAFVVLDGSRSSDPDGDALAFAWTSGSRLLGGDPVVTASFALGEHDVQLAVDDGRGEAAFDAVRVRVQDTIAPALALVAGPTSLWPPDGRFEKVLSSVAVRDACCAQEPLITVTGAPSTDSRVERTAGGSYDVYVRAARDGQQREGRLYQITVAASDCAGHAASYVHSVHVPHDKRR